MIIFLVLNLRMRLSFFQYKEKLKFDVKRKFAVTTTKHCFHFHYNTFTFLTIFLLFFFFRSHFQTFKQFCMPERFNTSISHQLFGYKKKTLGIFNTSTKIQKVILYLKTGWKVRFIDFW